MVAPLPLQMPGSSWRVASLPTGTAARGYQLGVVLPRKEGAEPSPTAIKLMQSGKCNYSCQLSLIMMAMAQILRVKPAPAPAPARGGRIFSCIDLRLSFRYLR